MEDSNQLLHFLTAATSSLQNALSQPSNGKKVNHRKYIQKRLQRNTSSGAKLRKTATKTATTTPSAPVTTATGPRPQPVATAAATFAQQPVYWQQPAPVPPTMTSAYEQYYLTPSSSPLVTSSLPSAYSSPAYSASYSRPPSCPLPPPHSEEDELENLLTEIGLSSSSDSNINMLMSHPPHTVSHPSVTMATTATAPQPPSSSLSTTSLEAYLPSDSPLSDFSDIDDSVCSAYSSPRNPSPVCYPPTAPSPQCPSHIATAASCEWLQPSVVGVPSSMGGAGALPASLLDVMPTLGSSLNDWNLSQLNDLHVMP